MVWCSYGSLIVYFMQQLVANRIGRTPTGNDMTTGDFQEVVRARQLVRARCGALDLWAATLNVIGLLS